MTRRILPLIVFGACLVGFSHGADEPKGDDDPPVRLKKKKRDPEQPKDDKTREDKAKDEKAKDEKKDEKAKEDMPKDEPGPGAKEDEKEVLDRISRNMKSLEDRFINKELNEGTRQLEDDIIKDIDSLIKAAENPPPEGGGGGGGGGGGNGASGGSSGAGGRRRSGGGQPMGQGGNNNPKPMGGNQGSREGVGTTGKGVTSDNDPPKPPPEDDKGKWGHLPESLRAQMNAYATKETYMSKHAELIKEYYRNLAKKKTD